MASGAVARVRTCACRRRCLARWAPALTEAGMLVGAQDVSRFGPCAHTGEPTRGADMPDGIFLGRGGLAPENFLATVDEVRSAS